MLARLLTLLGPTLASLTGVRAEVPRHVIGALEPVADERRDVTPWLQRVAACADAHVRAAGPFVPYECVPPASLTIGFAALTSEVASFESDRYPGCGDAMPRWLERRSLGGRALTRVALREGDVDALTVALERAWLGIAELVLRGFAPPVPAIAGEARLQAGDRTTRPAVVLGPPLDGWLLYLDDLAQRVVLSGPDAEPTTLARLPASRRGLASIWDVAVSPDARWLILRLAAIEGSPCDPASIERLDLEVPERIRERPLGSRVRWSQDERACLAAGDRRACEARCADRADRCAEVARRVEASDKSAAIALYARACGAGDGASCAERLRLDPPSDSIAIKGGVPPWVKAARAEVRARLIARCESHGLAACTTILDYRDARGLWRPTPAEARRAKSLASRALDAACARDATMCTSRDALRTRRVE